MRRVSDVFECEIQARFRDLNIGNHVDSVEAIRLMDEARIQFFMFTPLGPATAHRRGLLTGVPEGVADLMAAQRIDYRAEMRYVPFQPFLMRLWISHIGRTSFRVACELRVDRDGAPTVLAESAIALHDRATGRGWAITPEVRDMLERYRGGTPALYGQ